ncbi:MAG: hypothetical protein A2091_13350 [Desulfuromonadales bacterium GWD2_61_12]|nr:MAG: hypothetical protein A2005_11960 [Desulfuromonadales bacterium GWC2_61_20]OGR35621.1 MAG: hypothetical protein A2091_13350 [Desulfuromonadales bacterium GWD2_61_12]
MRELILSYEQYFMGTDKRKREPIKDREELAKFLRRFANRRIIQTDMRFRYQNMATKFHSYQGYWDRILRLMDEGRYVRQSHVSRSDATSNQPKPAVATAPPPPSESDHLYEQLLQAHRHCNLDSSGLNRQQVASLLDKQREAIQQKFGDRPVEFVVVTDDGKPKIKVRAKP